ncbi:MAG TPA: hypothetical protein VIO57_13420 [Chloroflexota bacterium]|jgi:hypothetical protein
MGSPTEAQTRLAEQRAQRPAHRLVITPWIEIEALCRLTLLRYLEGCSAELAAAAAEFFDSRHGEDDIVRDVDTNVWSRLKTTLERITVVDPACGEAHMLVGALDLLDTLLAHADGILGFDTDPRTRRLAIVQNSLYGVEAQVGVLSRGKQRLARAAAGPNHHVCGAGRSNLVCGDSLVERDEFHWSDRFRPVMEAGGFHLVLGNPPYVRHEQIADPLNRLPAGEYKQMAFAAVQAKRHVLFDAGSKDPTSTSLSRRSDLSVLFTLFGLSLLRPGGALGFVVPNALSSAQYGEPFWQILGSGGFESRIVENLARRSFAHAAVNTSLLLAWRGRENPGISSGGAGTRREPPSSSHTFSNQCMGGQERWATGLSRLHSKISGHCTALGTLGQLRYPIKTGLNCFFYPDADTRSRFNIESRFLIPVIKSPRDVAMLAVAPSDLRSVLFHCSYAPAELLQSGASGALTYIAWGSGQSKPGRDARTRLPWPAVPSLRGRDLWYAVTLPAEAHILCPRFFHRRFFFALPEPGILEDQTFYGLRLAPYLQSSRLLVGALLNSSLSYLMIETHGRTGLGDGVRQFALRDMAALPVPDPGRVDASLIPALMTVLARVASRPILSIEEDVQQDDRIELDALTCAAMGLSAAAGADARQYLTALVEQRLARARRREHDGHEPV